MSLKRNVLASYVGQLYVTLISIVMVPLYLRYLGAESYGLVGFFAMLQAWFQLLDMGLTPTMSRETARFNGGATDALSLRRLLRALEYIFVLLAACAAITMIGSADYVATAWLKVQHLPTATVQQAIVLMALISSLRWVAGLYRATVTGFEKLVWLSTFNIVIASLRFVLVIPFFIWVSTDLVDFFRYQLAIAIFELAALLIKAYSVMPPRPGGATPAWQWAPLRMVLKFSFSVAFTSSVWVLVTQTDKLMLSKLLPLTEYAYFTLAVLVASGVTIISGPIANALMPRLSRLAAEQNESGIVSLYCQASQFVAVIAIPVALMMALYAEQLLWIWTGDRILATTVAPVLALYALGNGILALGAFPYYLQFAKGNLRLHIIGNVIFLVLLVPAITWATSHFGMRGAGYAWLGINILYFVVWVPYVHRQLVHGLHLGWLLDLASVAICSIVAGAVIRFCVSIPNNRFTAGLWLLSAGTIVLCAAALGSPFCRTRIRPLWARLRKPRGQISGA